MNSATDLKYQHSELATSLKSRINSIDALRGLVMLIMLVDHVRERFFLHQQVTDPMNIQETGDGLFWSRIAAHFCAPTFVFLTGLSAWLYQNSGNTTRPLQKFLFTRGLFLIVLEITLVTFSWFGGYHTIYLQVIWAIGLSMIALAVMHPLGRVPVLVIGLIIVCTHNALSFISFNENQSLYSIWTILHDRGYLLKDGFINIKVSYPSLPWIGLIFIGYGCGALYGKNTKPQSRQKYLLAMAGLTLLSFLILRGFNLYGEDYVWHTGETALESLKAMVNLTKYPPSLNFLLLTLTGTFLVLRLFECKLWMSNLGTKLQAVLVNFGSAPMFFYLLHLYVLLLMYKLVGLFMEPNYGDYISVSNITWVWIIALGLMVILYFPTKRFSQYKKMHKNSWTKYL
ncbi:DUF1624 domain-containing protein [Sessilibacter sp. MAH2]